MRDKNRVVKTCKKHGNLSVSETYVAGEYKGRLYYHCKRCKDIYNDKFKKENPELRVLYAQRSYVKRKDTALGEVRDWRDKNRLRRNEYRMAAYYLKKGNVEPMRQYKRKYDGE